MGKAGVKLRSSCDRMEHVHARDYDLNLLFDWKCSIQGFYTCRVGRYFEWLLTTREQDGGVIAATVEIPHSSKFSTRIITGLAFTAGSLAILASAFFIAAFGAS